MLSIFTRYSKPEHSNALRLYPTWRYLNLKLTDNVRGAVLYQRSLNSRPNTTNNPLYRVLFTHCPDISLNDYDFYKEVTYSIEHADSFYGFISLNNKGKAYNNIIYKGCQEIFVNDDEDLDFKYMESEEEWKNLRPLRMIYTNNTDLDFCVTPGKKMMSGVVMYNVNIKKLLFQYKKWADYRMANYASIDPAIYLLQYAFPNMILDYTNLSIFNRLMYYIKNNKFPRSTYEKFYPFYVVNVTDGIDSVLEHIVEDFSGRRVTIDNLLRSIPTCNFGDEMGMMEYLKINVPEIAKNANWVPYITRIGYINNILNMFGEIGIKYNKDKVSDFYQELKALSTGMVEIPGYVDPFLVEDMKSDIENLKSIFLSNLNLKLR